MALDPDPQLDWARLTDGRPHVLVRGEDFTRDPRKVRKAAGMWAYRNGYRCRTEISNPETVSARLTVWFLPREAVRT